LVLLFVFTVISDPDVYCSPTMDRSTREKCLRDKIYAKIPEAKIYRILFNGLYGSSSYNILISTYYFEPDYLHNFTYLDGVTITYESKNPGRAPGSPPCSQVSSKVCPDGTVVFADVNTCQFPACYTKTGSPCSGTYKHCPDGTLLIANSNCLFKPCPNYVPSWIYWVPILIILAVILLSFIIFVYILKRWRQRQALEGLNDIQSTNPSGGSNYFMRTNNIASTQSVYLYQPNSSSSIMTNGPIPTGYVPVLQTNVQPNIPLSSDEIYARELQTKFDQGY